MPPPITDTEVASCFQQLIANRPNINKYKEIVDKFAPVHFEQIPPLKMINNTGGSNRIIEQHRELEDEFYEQKFVPSPDLLLNYQQTFIKSLRGQQPCALVNRKLQNLYQQGPQNPTNPFVGKQNHCLQPATLPYHTISPQYNYQPLRAENKHVFVQEREQVILKELRDKNKAGLEMSIPVIEKSLLQNEIRSLEMKNITVENLGKLSAWKEKREQMENRLKRK